MLKSVGETALTHFVKQAFYFLHKIKISRRGCAAMAGVFTLLAAVQFVYLVAQGHQAVAQVDILYNDVLMYQGKVVVGKVPKTADTIGNQPVPLRFYHFPWQA